MKQQWAACEKLVGSDDVLVLAVAESRSSLVGMIADDILPIYYRTGARTPQVGDRLGTWVDVSTRYVMAPR